MHKQNQEIGKECGEMTDAFHVHSEGRVQGLWKYIVNSIVRIITGLREWGVIMFRNYCKSQG